MLTTAQPLHTDNGAIQKDKGFVHKDDGSGQHYVIILVHKNLNKKYWFLKKKEIFQMDD